MIKVEIIFKQIFWDVPAFNLEEPAINSELVFKSNPISAVFKIIPSGLFEIPIVNAPTFFDSSKTLFVNGVFPLAASPITISLELTFSALTFFFDAITSSSAFSIEAVTPT